MYLKSPLEEDGILNLNKKIKNSNNNALKNIMIFFLAPNMKPIMP